MSRIIYRNMTSEDIEQVVGIENRIFSRPWTKDNFLDSLRLEDTIYIVALNEESGEVLGYCGCYQSFEEGNITNVAVSESARRQGIARELVSIVLKQGRMRGIHNFILEVRVSNLPAITLYEKIGFETAGIRKNFYMAPVEDARIMLLEMAEE